ncbi:phosphonate C-P lyase system protein PhnH [Sutcliffiella halmapala]|uniref:phosphonate C-P lyase system protein PhnH n=1 Tax=Sutcliffiella halmapala TaxID=79882 RepID=UPI000994BDAC|nr:phosphonate C-P lyase system protein PhnH [Sutcliffiella halmapala]
MTKANVDSFDIVKETQVIYRKLLDCMARPGKIENISSSVEDLTKHKLFSPVLEGIVLALVDQEVSFKVVGPQSEEVMQYLKWKTFGVEAPISMADFIFIPEELMDAEISPLMKQVKIGTLEDPHLSATIIILVKNLSTITNDNGNSLTFQGPGIAEKMTINIEGMSNAWLSERKKINKEFPLGVDFIFVTEAGDIMAIPRTTLIESE